MSKPDPHERHWVLAHVFVGPNLVPVQVTLSTSDERFAPTPQDMGQDDDLVLPADHLHQ